ncbi:hypothetical protein BDY24DRAFT_440691 [Mrakia frigida]|uniref:uncharacterized protein n=1 Tax=Mrakia frigida TaxID=29902 RepID=UPI003FCC1947
MTQDSARDAAHDAHIQYWQQNSSEGEKWQSAKDRFDAGFNKGWEDASNGQNDEDKATQDHEAQAGAHPREWQFTHGYRAGQEAQKSGQ